MRVSNVIPFPAPQRKQMRPIMFPQDKSVFMMPALRDGCDAPRAGLLDEFAIWASRFGRRLTARRTPLLEGRHEA
jgi:hypothetical protein